MTKNKYGQAEGSGQAITTGRFGSYLQKPGCGEIFAPPRHNCCELSHC